MTQMSMYQMSQSAARPSHGFDALPESLPPGMISFDTETNGLDFRAGVKPFCFSIATADDEWCCHWDDNAGLWLEEHLYDRDVVMANAKFDIWAAFTRWVDFEALKVRPHDVQHCAALLDDRRRQFSLDVLAQERLGVRKLDLPHKRIWELPTNIVVPYARRDARLTYDLWKNFEPDIKQQKLGDILALEDALIYSTLCMEREGCPLDMPKLERWCAEVNQLIMQKTLEIWRMTKLRVNPNTSDMAKLMRYLGIPHSGYTTSKGKESFSDPALDHHRAGHPALNLALEVRELKSWLSKCGEKYLNSTVNGVLYYHFHQLRADEGGTITGRYAGDIQQVMKPDKQAPVTKPWIVRELFKGEGDNLLLDADASQIEYRLFAHFSCVPWPYSKRLIKAYNDDPNIDFHDFVTHDILRDIMIRSLAKNVNFAKLYGSGVGKISAMTGLPHDEAEIVINQYDSAFPEARRLLNYCTKLAENRGWVKTVLGRRRRYYPGDRFYSALNSILQGTAAEIMKLKILKLYEERKTTGFTPRLTNHDEVLGDITAPHTVARVTELLAEQALELRVPITWDIGVGKNWLEAMA